MRKLLLIPLCVSLLSCSAAGTQSGNSTESVKILKNPSKQLKENAQWVKSLMSLLLKYKGDKNDEVVDVEPTNLKVTLRAYRIKFYNKFAKSYIYKYAWVSDNGSDFAIEIFQVKNENGEKTWQAIAPKKKIQMVKTDLSWLPPLVKELTKNNIPHEVGKGEKTVYVVWDVYCPFCYSHFKEVAKKLQKGGLKLVFIPLAVHGEKSVKGFVYYTYLARKEGAAKAMLHLFDRGNGNYLKFSSSLEKEVEENYSKIPKEEREKLEKFFINYRNQLLKNGIKATPTLIYMSDKEHKKGYVHIGFIPFKKLTSMK